MQRFRRKCNCIKNRFGRKSCNNFYVYSNNFNTPRNNNKSLTIAKEIDIEKIKEDKQEVNEIKAVNQINITISNSVVEKNKNKSSILDKEKEKIKQYLSSVYEIDEKDILVN